MRKLGVVAIVVIGLMNISRAVEIAFSARSTPVIQFLIPTLAMSLILLAFGAGLIAKRHQLADRWFHETAPQIGLDAPSLVRLGLILFGILLLIRAIPGMFGGVVASIVMMRIDDGQFLYVQPSLATDFVFMVVEPFIAFCIALGLILRSGPLADRLWSTGPRTKGEAASLFPQCPLCGTPFDPSDYRSDAGAPKCTTCGEPLNLSVENWNARGVGLDREGKHEEAIKYFEKAIEIDPADADLWNNKGMSLDDLRRFDEAIAAYDRALDLSPQDADIWYNKGYSLLQDEKLQEAMACFSKALELEPEHADALSAMASLKEIFRRQE